MSRLVFSGGGFLLLHCPVLWLLFLRENPRPPLPRELSPNIPGTPIITCVQGEPAEREGELQRPGKVFLDENSH